MFGEAGCTRSVVALISYCTRVPIVTGGSIRERGVLTAHIRVAYDLLTGDSLSVIFAFNGTLGLTGTGKANSLRAKLAVITGLSIHRVCGEDTALGLT